MTYKDLLENTYRQVGLGLSKKVQDKAKSKDVIDNLKEFISFEDTIKYNLDNNNYKTDLLNFPIDNHNLVSELMPGFDKISNEDILRFLQKIQPNMKRCLPIDFGCVVGQNGTIVSLKDLIKSYVIVDTIKKSITAREANDDYGYDMSDWPVEELDDVYKEDIMQICQVPQTGSKFLRLETDDSEYMYVFTENFCLR